MRAIVLFISGLIAFVTYHTIILTFMINV